MYILLVGLNHKTAPLGVREKFSFTTKQKSLLYTSFRTFSTLEELLIVSTCNRTELYAIARNQGSGEKDLYEILSRQAGEKRDDIRPFLYAKACEETVLHLYQVAAGLDSMILGETQILGQLKQAYAEAKAQGACGPILNQLLQKAFAVGKKVRTQTAIDQHSVSISSIAVEQAKRQNADFSGKKILVVGAGEAGQLAARYLKNEGVQAIFISNRSTLSAQKLAQDLNGVAVRFDALAQYLSEVDIVISCTGANHLVIHGQACQNALHARQGKPIFLIDIAVPRDIDPAFAQIPGVALWDMDRLQEVVRAEEQQRLKAAEEGQKIVWQEVAAFRDWSASLHVVPVVAALKTRGEAIRKQALERALNRCGREHLTEREVKIFTEMGQSIVNQLLRAPVENLKQFAAAGEGEVYAAAAKKLFGLSTRKEDSVDESDEALTLAHRNAWK